VSAAQALAADVGTLAACDALGVTRATVYRRRTPKPESAPRPSPTNALTPLERQAILETLNSETYADVAPAQASPSCSTKACTSDQSALSIAPSTRTIRCASGAPW